MSHPLLDSKITEQAPSTFIREIGQVFSVFDEHTQDSGNISYGVKVDQQRFFVKTGGKPVDPRPFPFSRAKGSITSIRDPSSAQL